MKKFLILFTFLGLGMLNSCGDDNASEGEALTVTSDVATRYEGESFNFTVKSEDGSDVSSEAKILVDDVEIPGNSFYSPIPGTFAVKAMYSGTTTKPIQVTVTANPVALTTITVTPSATTVIAGDVLTFTAIGNNSSNLSQSCKYYVNGEAITGNTYTATAEGTLEVYATYGESAPSEKVNVTVNMPINFTKRVLVEDYTGAWCQYCPRVAWAIELLKEQDIKAVPVAIHSGSTNPSSQSYDPFNFSEVQMLMNTFGVSGFPAGKLDRKITWTGEQPKNLKQVSNLTTGVNPRIGLAMNTSIEGATATVKVNVKFGQNFSDLKLVVYALEDNLIGEQINSTQYYAESTSNYKIKDFKFDDVLRKSLTNVLGDAITGSTNVKDVYTTTLTYEIPSTVKAENLHFVAFVVDASKKALNVRKASNNENQTYEEITE